MTEPFITMVLPQNINGLWAEVAKMIEPALSLSMTHNIDDVYDCIMNNEAQLWIQWSGKVDAAVITEIIYYPRGQWCRIWLGGAVKNGKIPWKKFFDTLYGFAKKSGCVGIEDCGRQGWEKYVPTALKVTTLRRLLIKD